MGEEQSPIRRAHCSCGQLVATCRGEPLTVAVCHCLECQRWTGSAFSNNAWFGRSQVAVTGRATEFTRVGDEGGRVTFRFCPECGGTVWYSFDGEPEEIAVPVGTFADPSFPEPDVSVYHETRRRSWVTLTTRGPLKCRG